LSNALAPCIDVQSGRRGLANFGESRRFGYFFALPESASGEAMRSTSIRHENKKQ
jgi:hypothetical protein